MNAKRHRAAGALCLLLLAPACAGMDDDRDRRRGGGLDEILGGVLGGLGRTTEYRCDDDRRFEATFTDGGDRVEVRTRRDTYRLRLEDRDGRERQYGDDDVILYVDRGEARLRIKDEPDYTDCEPR